MELIIEIILVWDDAEAFQRHVAAMKSFRQSHPENPPSKPKLVRNTPPPGNPRQADSRSGAKRFTRTRAKPTLVPIWEMELPRGIQN